jgi:hypothetical protein
MIDDLTGKELDGDGRTVTFTYKNTDYSIDLSAANVQKLEKALEPYIKAAQKVSGGRRGRPTARTITDPETLHIIREWGKAQGLKVSDRGRVSKEVRDAYEAAH